MKYNISSNIVGCHLTTPSPEFIPEGMYHEHGAFSRCRAVKILNVNLSFILLLNKDMVKPANPYEILLCLT